VSGRPNDEPDAEGRTSHGARAGESWRLRVAVVEHPDHAGWRQLRISFPARAEGRLRIGEAIKALLGTDGGG
jgi:hypothetical protein